MRTAKIWRNDVPDAFMDLETLFFHLLCIVFDFVLILNSKDF